VAQVVVCLRPPKPRYLFTLPLSSSPPPSPLPLGNELDGWNGTDRDHFDAAISAQDLADSYLVPFEACVTKGQASGIMCR
jgi:hypothetical protein